MSIKTCRSIVGGLEKAVFLFSIILMVAGCQRTTESHAPPVLGVSGTPQDQGVVGVDSPGQSIPFDPSEIFPGNFGIYGSVLLSDRDYCVVGAMLSSDLGLQTPRVYRVSSDGKSASVWADLSVPEGHYQARATHCIEGVRGAYVLVQSDTRPERSLSQTFVYVDALPRQQSAASKRYPVRPPSVKSAYSAWVDGDEDSFAYANGKISVKGRYKVMASPEAVRRFSVEFNP